MIGIRTVEVHVTIYGSSGGVTWEARVVSAPDMDPHNQEDSERIHRDLFLRSAAEAYDEALRRFNEEVLG